MNYYAVIGILAAIILVVSNNEIIFKKRSTHALKAYRFFLATIFLYYLADILWGFLDASKIRLAVYIDTELFFVCMAIGITAFTNYTVVYVEDNSVLRKIFVATGILFAIFVSILMIINLFTPIVFKLDDDCNYVPGFARYLILGVQIIILFLTSGFALIKAIKTKSVAGKRYLMISLFGMVMLTSIAIQMFFPILPLYSIGYMIGSCLLQSFIIGNEKEEYRLNLETSLEREKKQSKELKEAWSLAYKDALTGAGSKLAYLEKIEKIDILIHDKKLGNLSILVFDINNLKAINDTQGHQAGDKCIIDAYELIKEVFKDNIIYRIGGDEFVTIIEDDYDDRMNLVDIFNEKVEENLKNHKVVISLGMADYNNNTDKGVRRIVERADFLMYERKEYLKAKLI